MPPASRRWANTRMPVGPGPESARNRCGGAHSRMLTFCHSPSSPSKPMRKRTPPVSGRPVYVPIQACIAVGFVRLNQTSSIGAWNRRSNCR